jgi:hypothetical protein
MDSPNKNSSKSALLPQDETKTPPPNPPKKKKKNKTKQNQERKKEKKKQKSIGEIERREQIAQNQNFFTRKKIQPNWRNREKKPNYPKPKTFSRDFTRRRRRRRSRRKDENEEGSWVLLVLQGNNEGGRSYDRV